MLVKLGVRVTGSDSARSYMTDALEKAGIHVFIGQRAENVDGSGYRHLFRRHRAG